MKILVIGSGAREHAILRSLEKEGTNELFSIGGNPGIHEIATKIVSEDSDGNCVEIKETDSDLIVKKAVELGIELVIVGPEAPLAVGIVDVFHEKAKEIRVFGPTKAASELEASKSFAKDVMNAAGVSTANAVRCESMHELVQALNNADSSVPYVVKADGLMAGKGVIVTKKRSEAEKHASEVFHSGGFVILEDFLDGPEFSQFFICDGETCVPLQPAQDFKRAFDNDEGPNTGGMGSYTPLTWLQNVDGVSAQEWSKENVAQKVIDEMKKRKTPFVGILFAGLVQTKTGIKVIEFNVRFGDPETQVVLEALKSNLSEILFAAAGSDLKNCESVKNGLKWSTDSFCNVVLASGGYPGNYEKGKPIKGIAAAEAKGAIVLQAGTRFSASDIGQILTDGGRVLSVIQSDKSLKIAREKAYNAVKQIAFDGMQFRSDIALKAVEGKI